MAKRLKKKIRAFSKKLAPKVNFGAKIRCNSWDAKGRCNNAAKSHPSAHFCGAVILEHPHD